MNKRYGLLHVLAVVVALFAWPQVQASTVDVGAVSYGGPGRWTINFWVKSNLPQSQSDMGILVFGLQLPESAQKLPQPDFDGYSQHWTIFLPGAPARPVEFRTTWTASTGRIDPSELLDGFKVQLDRLQLPETVPWFVLARSPSGGHYVGTDNLGTQSEPIFAGELRLLATPVPEVATHGLMILGLAALAAVRMRQVATRLAA